MNTKNRRNESTVFLKKVALIGVGMIGGSFVWSLKNAGIVGTIIGIDCNEKELDKALQLGVIDEKITLEKLSSQAVDAIIIATPVGAMPSIFSQLAEYQLIENILITDVGSTKQSVIDAAEKSIGYLPENFVPSHPIAGREYIGVGYAEPAMFDGFKSIVTPHKNCNQQAINTVVAMWQACGAKVDIMSARNHDHILAATSHLPHILAYTLVDSMVTIDEEKKVFDYAAGGFKSFTRTASSNPIMWRDVCLNNHQEILAWLDNYQQKLSHMRDMIATQNGEEMEKVFANAKAIRDDYFE